MDVFETIERDGYTIRLGLEHDTEPFDPRGWDNLSTMVCWHPDYYLGDFQITNGDGRGAIGGGRKTNRWRDGAWHPYTTPETRYERDDFKSMRHLCRYLGIVKRAVGILPLYLYDHSGISMSAGSRNPFDSGGWDTSMVGFAFTTHERITELCGDDAEYHTDERIEEMVRADVRTYDQYLTGDIWWYSIEHRGEVIDGCGGYFGDESAKAEANGIVDGYLRERAATIEAGMHKWHWLAKLSGQVTA